MRIKKYVLWILCTSGLNELKSVMSNGRSSTQTGTLSMMSEDGILSHHFERLPRNSIMVSLAIGELGTRMLNSGTGGVSWNAAVCARWAARRRVLRTRDGWSRDGRRSLTLQGRRLWSCTGRWGCVDHCINGLELALHWLDRLLQSVHHRSKDLDKRLKLVSHRLTAAGQLVEKFFCHILASGAQTRRITTNE